MQLLRPLGGIDQLTEQHGTRCGANIFHQEDVSSSWTRSQTQSFLSRFGIFKKNGIRNTLFFKVNGKIQVHQTGNGELIPWFSEKQTTQQAWKPTA